MKNVSKFLGLSWKSQPVWCFSCNKSAYLSLNIEGAIMLALFGLTEEGI